MNDCSICKNYEPVTAKTLGQAQGGQGMTNGDRIRAMTDEELACFLDQVQIDAFLFGQGLKDKLGREEDSASAWLDWLKMEGEE